ncbi:hypothetical protein [Clostridium sp. HBUAS56017]|uniref:hypothetical protein n=1 Tax=Clostridium sp. HBUAS56017 TaxID=2571128 RepID=UPI00117897D4|nr:hypothetical protein [Clostridium sp. HBUAS56017]
MSLNSVGELLRNIRKKRILDDKIEIKINGNEKLLFEKYAKMRGLDMEELIKGLVRCDIDKFIKG